MSNPPYTVQRCRKNGETYGSIHGSMDANTTLCGIEMGENWWVLTNAFDAAPECKRCLKAPLAPNPNERSPLPKGIP